MPVPPRAPASGGIATLLPPECTNTASDFRRALRRNRRQLIRLSVIDAADELEDTRMLDSLALPAPCPLDLPLPAVARIVHYFSTPISRSSISWSRPNLDVVSTVLTEDAISQLANADCADADRADALLRAMDFPGFALRSMDAAAGMSGMFGWERGWNEKCAGGDDLRTFLRLFAAAAGTTTCSRNMSEAGIGGGAGISNEDGSADADEALLPLNSLVERSWIHSPEGQLDLLLCLLQMKRRNNGSAVNSNASADAANADGLFWHLLSEEERVDVDEIINGTTTSAADYDTLPNPIGLASTKVLYRLLQCSDYPCKPILGEKVMKFLFGASEGEPGVVTQFPEALIFCFIRLDKQFMSGGITLGPRARRFMIGAVDQLRSAYFRPLPSSARIARTRSVVYRRLWEVAPDDIDFACLKLWHAVIGKDGSIPDDRTALHATISHIANIICHSAETTAAISTLIDGKKDFEYQLTIATFLADTKVLNLSEWLVDCAKIRRSGQLFVEAVLHFAEKEYVKSFPRKKAGKNGITILSLENLATLLRFLSQKIDTSITAPHTKKRIKRLMKKCFHQKGKDRHFTREFRRPTLATIEEEEVDPFDLPGTTSPNEERHGKGLYQQPLNVAMSNIISLEDASPAMAYGSPTKHRGSESSTACNPGDHRVPNDGISEADTKKKWSSPTSVKDIVNISATSLVPADNSFDSHNFLTTTKKNIPVSASTLSINMNALQAPVKKTEDSTNIPSEPKRLAAFEAKLKTILDGILANIDAAADRLIAAAGPSASRLLCLAEIPRDHDIKRHLLNAALCVETALNGSDPKSLEAIECSIILFTEAVFDKLYETPTRPEPFRQEAHVGLLELILVRMPKLKPKLVAWGDKRNHAETKEQRSCHARVASLLLRAGLMSEEIATL